MEGIIIILLTGLMGFVGFYIGILAAKTDPSWKAYSDPIIKYLDRIVSREERKTRIKKDNGFDSSYDKYIA